MSDNKKEKNNFSKASEWLTNLYQNKVIYHERVDLIVRLDDLIIDEKGFRAKAIREHILKIPPFLTRRKTFNQDDFFSKNFVEWNIGTTFKYGTIDDSDKSISGYGSFQIWTDPATVQKIEQLIIEGKKPEAIECLKKVSSFF